jgi:class 3 adenylate cyclase/predicted ATPase
MDPAEWLRGLGLEQYASAFRENDIDGEILLRLTAEDLRELGIASIGHRRRLLDAIAALGAAGSGVISGEPGVPAAAGEAERRQLTVMFCDLVGSTALAGRHDPEDLREIVGAYHGVVSETVGRFDGFVAKYMGDGVLIYFGYPQAHEDDAERAVRAGLAVVGAVAGLDIPERLAVRLGIASGLAVVGDLLGEGAAQERGVVGETPNLAARLQGLAEPGTAVIADGTRRQLGTLFDVEDLGLRPLAGFGEKQRAWRVLGESGVLSRFEALRSGTTPLVGRNEELELLLRRWRQATAGEGRVVLISGEPGIGKSRLTAALSEHIAAEPHTRLRYFCSPHHQDSVLHPFIVQLERAAGFVRDDTAEQKLAKLKALLGAGDADEITLVAELLSLPNAVGELNLSPQRKREKLFEALLGQFDAVARSRPVLMVFEDAHWIDPSSRELLDLTLDRVGRLPVLLVVTFRPEFQHGWGGQAHVTVLALNRLGGRDGVALVQSLAGNTALDAEIVAEIVERTDGVPLFVEELTKAVLESAERENRVAVVLASSPLSGVAIPATLHASLIARLDRLGMAAKEVAQIGSVLGREFTYELIDRVARRPDLDAALAQLSAAELLFCRGAAPQSSYLFKHALVQDTAYSVLLRGRRRELHARVADVLQAEFGEVAKSRPELLAHHFTEAGQPRLAAAHWGEAGRRSASRSAMAEAATQLRKGLDQLSLLPGNPERWGQELELQSSLGAAALAVNGHAAPETGLAYARARELWEQLGCPSEFLHVPYGQSLHYTFVGELDLAQRLDEDLLRLSSERNEAAGLVLGHYSFGRNLLIAGRFDASRKHLEQVLQVFDPSLRQSLIRQAGDDPHVNAQAVLGVVLFCLGYPEQALALTNASIAEAESLDHLPSLASSLAYSFIPFSLAGDSKAEGQRAEQLFEMATERGFAQWHATAMINRGWVAVMDGHVAEGISLLRSGSTAYRSTGAELWLPHFLLNLAMACEIAGQIEEAAAITGQAFEMTERTGQRWLLAEVNRYRGRFLQRQGQLGTAENLYRQALSIAKEQGAKLWELRAATSLARLWGEEGRRADARALLAPVYGWFTEGVDTPDLKEAKALLGELA